MKFSIDEIAEELSDLDIAILHLLKAKNASKIKGKVVFQKEIFLISNYIKKIEDKADFIPHSFGPYSESAEISMDELVSLGLVEKSDNGYKISKDGILALNKVKHIFSDEELEAIDDFKDFMNNLQNDEILLFVYVSFPDFTKESAVFQRVIDKRLPYSASLYKKGKISLEKAAFLAGISIEKFLDYLKGNQM